MYDYLYIIGCSESGNANDKNNKYVHIPKDDRISCRMMFERKLLI